MSQNDDPRYPYTHCADLIRSIAGYKQGGTKISRADASEIRQLFSKVLGMDDEEVAYRLADYFLENREELSDKCAETIIKQLGRMGE